MTIKSKSSSLSLFLSHSWVMSKKGIHLSLIFKKLKVTVQKGKLGTNPISLKKQKTASNAVSSNPVDSIINWKILKPRVN